MNTIIEKIRAEVERLKPRIRKICGEEVKIPVEKVREKFDTLLSFLSDLEKEEKPTIQEQPVELDEKTLYTELANVYGTYTRPDYIEENTTEASCDFECAIARHFAQWQKEKMMKEAVEGEIINAGYPTKIELNTFYSKFEHGQEVKLIIIKED